jgi:hypothetical protein
MAFADTKQVVIAVAVVAILAALYMGSDKLHGARAPPPVPGSVAAAVASVTGANGTVVNIRQKTPHTDMGGATVNQLRPQKTGMASTSTKGGEQVTPAQRSMFAPVGHVDKVVGNHGRIVGNVNTGPKSVAGIDTVGAAQQSYQMAAAFNPALISDLKQAHESRAAKSKFGMQAGPDFFLRAMMQNAGLEKDPADIVRANGCGQFNTQLSLRLPSNHPCFQEMFNNVQSEVPSRLRA